MLHASTNSLVQHGVLTISSILVLRETYAPALIAKKVAQLRKESGNTKLRSKFDTGLTPRQIFTRAIVRPCKMLIRSPIVLMLALQMSIIYSYLYFLFTTFTFVFEDTYGFNSGESGLAYLGIGIGLFIGQQTVSHWSDWHLKKKTAAHGGEKKPEWRLPPLFPGGLLIPGGLIWYGWTAEFGVHWIVPILGTGLIGIGTNWAFLPIQMYLIDTFGLFAASALATNTVVRSLFGATLPLSSQPLYDRLGLGWGNTLLAFIALVLSPIPLFLMRYGERIRTSPRFAIKNL